MAAAAQVQWFWFVEVGRLVDRRSPLTTRARSCGHQLCRKTSAMARSCGYREADRPAVGPISRSKSSLMWSSSSSRSMSCRDQRRLRVRSTSFVRISGRTHVRHSHVSVGRRARGRREVDESRLE